ncbi:MAG: hypothetical protein ACOC85_05755, partial [Thermoplasmatota archaeon]
LMGNNIERLLGPVDSTFEDVLNNKVFTEIKTEMKAKNGEVKTLDIIVDHLDFDVKGKKGLFLELKDITKETQQREMFESMMEYSNRLMEYPGGG